MKLKKGLKMYEQAIAHLRIKEPQKEKMQIYIDVPIRRTLDEIQKKRVLLLQLL